VSVLSITLTFIGGSFSLLVFAALKQVVIEEFVATVPLLGRCLLRSATRRLPIACSARYEREWLAELGSARPLQGLWFALTVRLAVRSTVAALSDDLDRRMSEEQAPAERHSDPARAAAAISAILARTALRPSPMRGLERDLKDLEVSLADKNLTTHFATCRFTAMIDEARICKPYVKWLSHRPGSAFLGPEALQGPRPVPRWKRELREAARVIDRKLDAQADTRFRARRMAAGGYAAASTLGALAALLLGLPAIPETLLALSVPFVVTLRATRPATRRQLRDRALREVASQLGPIR
jgi:hypothetical protein